MKKFNVVILLLAVMLAASCTKEPDMNNGPEEFNLPQVVLTQDEITSIAYDNIAELDEETVLNIFNAFAQLDSEKSGMTRSAVSAATIKSKYYIHLDDENVVTTSIEPSSATRSQGVDVFEAPIYEISAGSGNNQTFALVSGDPRVPKVIAFLPNATNEIYSNLETQIMWAMSKASVMEDIQKIEAVKGELREQTLEKLSEEWGMPKEEIVYEDIVNFLSSESNDATRGWSGSNFTDESNVYKLADFANVQIMGYVLPLGKTSWRQSKPYNRALPQDLIEPYVGFYEMGRREAGCGVIAMAEALAIVKPTGYFDGIKIDWTKINAQEYCTENPIIPGLPNNNTPEATLEQVGRLIKSIYYDSGTEPIYKTLPDGRLVNTGSVTTVDKMIAYLNSKIAFNPSRAWDPDIAKGSLDSFLPILCHGNARVQYHGHDYNTGTNSPTYDVAGHGYVIDGYMITQKRTRQLVQIYDVYWHLRLGWGVDCNGYYKLAADTKCQIVVDNDYMKVTINIGETGKITVNGKQYDIGQYMLTHLRNK